MYQENKSVIILDVNGKRSVGKRILALNICHSFIKDKVKKVNAQIEYFPTNDMWRDFTTKPMQEEMFMKLRNYIPDGKE